MRTLYLRIVLTFILIALASGVLALLVSNAYYANKLKRFNEQKISQVGREIVSLYEQAPQLSLDAYLDRIGKMGFQIYAVNERMEGTYYGGAFRHTEIDPAIVRGVLDGQSYYGMRERHEWLRVSGMFENSVRNSVGLPVQAQGHPHALFIRPNLEQQFGDVRIVLGILLSVTFALSLALIAIFTRYIVGPVKRLTSATQEIVGGHYDVSLDVSRGDEIGNLARHFTQMSQSLKRLDEMRQTFVANVSHEIQSPLTSIQGFAEALLNKDVEPEEEKRYLRIIADESRRMSSLSKQLLTLAALDKEQYALRPEAYRLDEQLRQAVILTERQWTEKRLKVEPELPEVVITADKSLLQQVWLNLIVNGIKFTEPCGTIAIRVHLAREVVVTIRDTGIGMTPDQASRMFERFYKADRARNRGGSEGGSGLGLSIAKKIVELHGGGIDAESAPGRGTTIRVRLPYTTVRQ